MKSKIISFVLGALLFALCFSAEAQQPKSVARIGYLSVLSPSSNSTRIEAFRQGLRELGYVEGQNIAIESRHADGKLDRLPDLAGELVRLKVDVIVVGGSTATRAAKNVLGFYCRTAALTAYLARWPRALPRSAASREFFSNGPILDSNPGRVSINKCQADGVTHG
jgi:hypothetical protein